MQQLSTRTIVIIAVIAALVIGIGAGCLLTVRARSAAVADNAAGQPPTDQPPVGQPPAGQPGSTSGTIGNSGNAGNESGTWIDVDVTKQRVYIMKGDAVQREMIASTGMEGYETPLGTFKIQNRGEWFFSKKYSEGAMWWVSFKDWGIYLFHSVAMDKDRNIIPEEAAKLGQPASHGCVRLAVEDAKWIYDNIRQGTKVVIHK